MMFVQFNSYFLKNSPEFLFTWIGLQKIGAVTSLINPNLSSNGLAHVLKISAASSLIVGAELMKNLDSLSNLKVS